jgi:hypothetical protein
MVRATYLKDPQHLRYQVDLFDWHVNVKLPAASFTSDALKTAPHMQFARPDAPDQARTQ